MDLNEYLNKQGITPESRARIDAHKRAMLELLHKDNDNEQDNT